MTLPFGANFGLLISFDQATVSQHLKVPRSDSFSDQLHTCLLPERVEANIWECLFESVGTNSSCNSNFFVDFHNELNVSWSK